MQKHKPDPIRSDQHRARAKGVKESAAVSDQRRTNMEKVSVTLLHFALFILAGTGAERYCDANERDCNRCVCGLRKPEGHKYIRWAGSDF